MDGELVCFALGLWALTEMNSGWCVGIDERFPGRRLQQCFIFLRNRPSDNLYAHPCDFVPVIGASPWQSESRKSASNYA